MNEKQSFNLFLVICLLLSATLCSCNFKNRNQNEWKDPEIVAVQDYDRSIQYYLPFNLEAVATGKPFTTDDLQASGRLLLTPGGIVKAMEFSDGYKKVYRFRCELVGNGWWQITCWLKSSLTKEEYSYTCYTREKI